MKKLTLILSCAILFSLISLQTCAAQDRPTEEEWHWYDADSTKRTRAELDTILARHERWVDKYYDDIIYKEMFELPSEYREDTLRANLVGADLIFADLIGANLIGAELRGADLTYAYLTAADLTNANLTAVDLTNANLDDANLTNVYLMGADLTGASLWDADLTDADLNLANLATAELYGADLNGANLKDADLTYAVLWDSDLTNADLSMTNLTGVELFYANLEHVLFETDFSPNLEHIAYALNLDQMTYKDNPAPLMHLKKAFTDAGFKSQAKQVNTALKRVKQTKIEYIFYDLTCEWGSNHNRPLVILLLSWLVFGAFYGLLDVRYVKPHTYLVASDKGLEKEQSEDENEWQKLENGLLAYGIAFLFSLHRALRIGFREFSPSSWLMMLLPPNFEMKSRGWPRFVSGLQSLFSVAMIVLSLLSYFGRPFEF
jgi:hypothetical protein